MEGETETWERDAQPIQGEWGIWRDIKARLDCACEIRVFGSFQWKLRRGG